MAVHTTDALDFNEDTLIALYDDHSDSIYRYAYRHLQEEHRAEDCVADVFTRFLERLTAGKPPTGNIRAYLYRIAHNWIVDFYRQDKPEEDLEARHLPVPGSNPEKQVSEKEKQAHLRKALLDLPEDQRLVIELHVMEKWPHEKVADVLGRSVEASRALQYRALKKLRQSFDSPGM
jgi:RNA polymerase sigma-70 factor (ECF subfamily)